MTDQKMTEKKHNWIVRKAIEIFTILFSIFQKSDYTIEKSKKQCSQFDTLMEKIDSIKTTNGNRVIINQMGIALNLNMFSLMFVNVTYGEKKLTFNLSLDGKNHGQYIFDFLSYPENDKNTELVKWLDKAFNTRTTNRALFESFSQEILRRINGIFDLTTIIPSGQMIGICATSVLDIMRPYFEKEKQDEKVAGEINLTLRKYGYKFDVIAYKKLSAEHKKVLYDRVQSCENKIPEEIFTLISSLPAEIIKLIIFPEIESELITDITEETTDEVVEES